MKVLGLPSPSLTYVVSFWTSPTIERINHSILLSLNVIKTVLVLLSLRRDPRQKRLQREQEERASTTQRQPDGAALTFKEKMKLFAVEVD